MASSGGRQEVIDLTMDDFGEILVKQEDAVIPNDNICSDKNQPKQEANTGSGDDYLLSADPSDDESTVGDEKSTVGDEDYLPDLDEDEDEDEDGYEEDDKSNIPIINKEVLLFLPAIRVKRNTRCNTYKEEPAIKQEIHSEFDENSPVFESNDDDDMEDETLLKNEENGKLKLVKKEEIFHEGDAEENVPMLRPFGHVVIKTEPAEMMKKEEEDVKISTIMEATISRDLGKYAMFGINKEEDIDNHDGVLYPILFGVFKDDINFQNEATSDRKRTRAELRSERRKWLGAIIYKDFGCMKHTGHVVDYNVETGWFKVMYEDSEYEDMKKEELVRHLANPNQFRSLFNRLASSKKHNNKRSKEATKVEAKSSTSTSTSSSKRNKKTVRKAKKKEATPYIPLAFREKKSDAYYWYR